MNSQLRSMKRQWDEEKRKLLGDQVALKDAANRLNQEVQEAKERIAEKTRAGERAKAGVQEVRPLSLHCISGASTDSSHVGLGTG